MARTSEMIESKYLKKEDVGDGALLTIRDVSHSNVAQEDKPVEMKWLLHFEETKKPLVLNTTNIQLCELICESDDTDHWIGCKVVAYNDPSIAFAGKLTGGIRVRKPRGKAAEAPKKSSFEDLESDIPF